MSEGTFDLTTVNLEQRQKTQEQQPPKKQNFVTSIQPKKPDEKRDENPQKSNTKLPPLEQKKANMQQSTNQGAQGQAQQTQGQLPTAQSQQMSTQNNMLMSKTLRAKSSKSVVNIRKIDNLKSFIDQERQLQSGRDDRQNNNKKKSDVNLNTSYLKRYDEESEKKKEQKYQFLEGYKKRIEQDYDQLYKQDDYENVVAQLKILENKVKLQQEIRRNEDFLNKEQKEYNSIKYEIEQKQKQLNAIKTQLDNLRHVFSTEEEKKKLQDQIQLYADYKQRLEDENIVQMSLKHMMDTRKKLILYEKEKSEKMHSDYLKKVAAINGYEEIVLQSQQKYANQQKKINHYSSLNAFNLNPRFQELIEDELSEYEDKNALNEIFKHEKERKDELVRLEKEARKQEQEQLYLENQKQLDKSKQEYRQVQQLLNQKKKNMEELLEVSRVSKIDELQDRKIQLEDDHENLNYYQQKFQKKIDQQKLEIEKLKKQLTELKYISKENDNSKNQKLSSQSSGLPLQETQQTNVANVPSIKQQKTIQIIEDDNLTTNVNIDKYEKILIEETDRLQDKENHVKRLERVVDEICLVFSRILYQLQPQSQKNKNYAFERKDLCNQITISGLKLEKIISFLAKKKDSLRVESINTDADNFQPPEYVGINPKSYIRERDLIEQREYEENQEPKFEYKENDPEEKEAMDYLIEQRLKIHERDENEKQKQNDKPNDKQNEKQNSN